MAYELRRWNGEEWAILESQEAAEALAAAVLAKQAADSKAQIFTQAEMPTGLGPDDVAVWTDIDDDNRSWSWSGTQWVPRLLGNGAIRPNSLVATDVIATGTIDAPLLKAMIVLASTIVAGDPQGEHVRMNPTGLRVFRGDLNGDGIPDEAVRMGVAGASDRFATVRSDGSLGFVVDEDAWITAEGISTEQEPRIAAPDYSGRGGSLYEILDRRPRGIVSWNTDNGIFDVNTDTGRGTFDIGAKLEYNRMYKIVVRCRVNGTIGQVNEAIAELQVRYSQSAVGVPGADPGAPSSPNLSSPLAGRFQAALARPEGEGVYFEKLFSHGPGVAGTYHNMRFLLALTRPVGDSAISMFGGDFDAAEMWIEDIGPYTRHAGTRNDGGGTVAVPGPPPAPQKTRYNRSWVCNWRQNWRGNGSLANLGNAYQGLDPSGFNGNMRSYLGFSGVATDGSGLTMQQALAGADIEEVGLFLFYPHWYSFSGGDAVIGMHGYEHPAPAFGGGNEWMHGEPGWRRNEGRWISLGRYSPQNWANGVWKGIMLGSGAAGSYQYYGYAHAESSATLNITYWK